MARPLFQYGKIVLGDLGVILLWIALLAGVLGACNASMISASRVLYQMSEEGDLPGIFSKLNGWGVPHIALITIWLLNVLMILYTPLYIVLVAVTQVPFLLTWFLIGVANIKIRGNREWHEKAAFKIPWIVAIAALIVGVLSLGFIYAYGMMYGWSDIEIGVVFVVLVIILWFINKITRKSH
jgi:amino acid transporter